MTRTDKQREIPSLLERFELKYQIPVDLVDPISDFVSIYCSKDRYSEKMEGGLYDLYSLYFDTPDFLFFRTRMAGSENRFNMRIRTYDPHTGMPCFFEVKQKRSGVVRKYRAVINDPQWPRFFESSLNQPAGLENANGNGAADAGLFIRLVESYQAAPKVLTHYRRKAFISDVDDYARVTFDMNMRYQKEENFNLIPDENIMNFYDNATVFDPECNVVLELKCYSTQVPVWMLDLIRYFDLKQGSFSKYAASISQVMALSMYDSGDRAESYRFCLADGDL